VRHNDWTPDKHSSAWFKNVKTLYFVIRDNTTTIIANLNHMELQVYTCVIILHLVGILFMTRQCEYLGYIVLLQVIHLQSRLKLELK
jgi:hypothetical protein